jgi:hypothetical protein
MSLRGGLSLITVQVSLEGYRTAGTPPYCDHLSYGIKKVHSSLLAFHLQYDFQELPEGTALLAATKTLVCVT